ncbi:MAG: hypothetical protein HY786_04670 [Deltaproteobacteria bacterium]|nr:hypothetical protein [Deltaproteobacteria bacterium]
MAATIPLELYESLEDKYGKDLAREITKTIEISFEAIEKKADAVVLQKKLELKDELTKELATKADLQIVKTELEAKIERVNQKLNFMIVLMVLALTLMNPVMADIIKHFLKL